MLDDDRDRIHLRIERRHKLFVGHLSHGALGEILVVAEQRKRVLKIGSSELQCHIFDYPARGGYHSGVTLDSLRRVLPYTALAIVLAAIYSGATMYSRYRDARDAEQRIKD